MIDLVGFLEKGGLYSEVELSTDDIDELIALLDGSVKLNLYCESCGEMRVFHLSNTIKIERLSQKYVRVASPISMSGVSHSTSAFAENQKNTERDFRNLLYNLNNRCLDFLCAFDDSHHICFYLRITSEEKVKLVKVGQFPSVATLATADLKRYQSVLPKNYRNEYSRALGLFSHGIGIGSFVYLRRIFEKLILDAFATAKAEGKLSEDIFNYDENKHQRRMEEKIKLLRGYLPDTIIDNAGIYGILSVGVHELSEDNCLKYFPVVDTGIQIMLDDYLEKRNRKKRDDTFAKEIAKIKGEVK